MTTFKVLTGLLHRAPWRREPVGFLRGNYEMKVGYKIVEIVQHPETGKTEFVSVLFPSVAYRMGKATLPLPGWGPLSVWTDLQRAREFGYHISRNYAVIKCFYEPDESRELRWFRRGQWADLVLVDERADSARVVILVDEKVISRARSPVLFNFKTGDGVYHASLADAFKWMAKKKISEPPCYGLLPYCRPDELWKVDGVDFPVICSSPSQLEKQGAQWADYLKSLSE